MDEVRQYFVHGYHNQTTLHPLGVVMLVVASGLLMALPRRGAMWPVLALACFVSPAQRIIILGGDFTLLRLIVLSGWLRVLLRNEYRTLRWRKLDTGMVLWASAGTVIPVIRAGLPLLVNRLGFAYDVVGSYLLFRCLVRDWADVRAFIRALMWMSFPVAAMFMIEWTTGRNVFSVFGGVPGITIIREGRLRCQGAFPHSILAGCFWASVLPMMGALWWSSNRLLVAGAMACCLLIVVACSSSTPVVAVFLAGVGACTFFVRSRIKWIMWVFVAVICLLHIVMRAPVWHLIARIQIVGGDSGYHRYKLIQEAINHLGEWWLMGSNKGSAHWGWLMYDVTNFYIVQGLSGGIPLLMIFIGVLVIAFRCVGRVWRAIPNSANIYLAWALGVSLFVHVMNFLVISYFGQIWTIWYLVMAAIGSVDSKTMAVKRRARSTSDGESGESRPVAGVTERSGLEIVRQM
jgi:hypothetical protein